MFLVFSLPVQAWEIGEPPSFTEAAAFLADETDAVIAYRDANHPNSEEQAQIVLAAVALDSLMSRLKCSYTTGRLKHHCRYLYELDLSGTLTPAGLAQLFDGLLRLTEKDRSGVYLTFSLEDPRRERIMPWMNYNAEVDVYKHDSYAASQVKSGLLAAEAAIAGAKAVYAYREPSCFDSYCLDKNKKRQASLRYHGSAVASTQALVTIADKFLPRGSTIEFETTLTVENQGSRERAETIHPTVWDIAWDIGGYQTSSFHPEALVDWFKTIAQLEAQGDLRDGLDLWLGEDKYKVYQSRTRRFAK